VFKLKKIKVKKTTIKVFFIFIYSAKHFIASS
jgi:hypothetical protein